VHSPEKGLVPLAVVTATAAAASVGIEDDSAFFGNGCFFHSQTVPLGFPGDATIFSSCCCIECPLLLGGTVMVGALDTVALMACVGHMHG